MRDAQCGRNGWQWTQAAQALPGPHGVALKREAGPCQRVGPARMAGAWGAGWGGEPFEVLAEARASRATTDAPSTRGHKGEWRDPQRPSPTGPAAPGANVTTASCAGGHSRELSPPRSGLQAARTPPEPGVALPHAWGAAELETVQAIGAERERLLIPSSWGHRFRPLGLPRPGKGRPDAPELTP